MMGELKSRFSPDLLARTSGKAQFQDASIFVIAVRCAVVVAIWFSTWSIAGFYPLPRFVLCVILALAAVALWMDLKSLKHAFQNCRSTIWGLVVAAALLSSTYLLSPPVNVAAAISAAADLRTELLGPETQITHTQLTLIPSATKSWIALFSIGLAGLLFGCVAFQTTLSRVWLLAGIAACGASQVAWGLLQTVLHQDLIFWGIPNDGGSIPFGTFLVRNHAADFLSVSLFCAIGLGFYRLYGRETSSNAYHGQSIYSKILIDPVNIGICVLVVWLAVGLGATMSRGGWLSFGTAFLIVALPSKKAEKYRSGALLLGAAATVVSALLLLEMYGVGDQLDRRLDDLTLAETLNNSRWQLWRDSLPAVTRFLPLGSGPGTYSYAYLCTTQTATNGWLPYAHNQYLETLIEMGIPGFCLLIAFLFAMFLSIRTLSNSKASCPDRSIGIACMGSLLVFVVHSFTDFGILMPANLLTFSVLLGASLTAGRPTKPLRKDRGKKTQPLNSLRPESLRPEVLHPARVASKRLNPNGWGRNFLGVAVLLVVTLQLAGACWHQSRVLRSDRLLANTKFDPKTPSPTVETTDTWITQVESALQDIPDDEPLRRRCVELYMHKAQRETYDQIRSGRIANIEPTNPISDWDSTALESIVMRIYSQGQSATPNENQKAIFEAISNESSLVRAKYHLEQALLYNPVQPRIHHGLALLAAASGKPWLTSFKYSTELSKVDPRLSLGNGLLAWAAHENKIMIEQWRQTLSTDISQLDLIYRLSRLRLGDDQIAHELMPANWKVPYRLQSMVQSESGTANLTALLLDRSKIEASKLSDVGVRCAALSQIAAASGDYAEAQMQIETALKSNARDAGWRLLAAAYAMKNEEYDTAARHARVGAALENSDSRFDKLLRDAQRNLRDR